jgi:hypothetical protein
MAFVFDLMINIVYPVIFGALGGFATAIYKNKGNLEGPTIVRLKTKTIYRLGFFKEVLLGALAAGLATNLFYAVNTMPQTLVGGIIAVFAGLAGGKYLFKSKNDTRTLDGEVNEFLDFLTKDAEEDEKE